MLLLAAWLTIAQAPTLEGDARLVEVLRDAQETNRASLRSGFLRARLENYYRYNNGREARTSLEGEYRWDGARAAWKIRIVDPIHSQMVLSQAGRPAEELTGPSVEDEQATGSAWDYLIRMDDRLVSYDHRLKFAAIVKRGSIPLYFFEIGPQDAWFVCCPPNGSQGRPWLEMIGPHPVVPDLDGCRFSIGRIDADRIRQVRHDPDGGKLTTEFSMAAGGNVVAHSYTGGRRRDEGTYRWQGLPDGRCVLRGWDFRYVNGPSPDLRELRSTLEVQEIDVARPVDPSHFSPEALFRRLPENVFLNDTITARRARINIKPVKPDTTKELLRLVPRVQARGFAKRRD